MTTHSSQSSVDHEIAQIDCRLSPAPVVASVQHWARVRAGDVAVCSYGGDSLTWKELDIWSGRLGAQLAAVAEPGDCPVVIVADHDHEAVVAAVAARRAGRPFVFIDTTTPAMRIAEIIRLATPVATFLAHEYDQLIDSVDCELGVVIPIDRAAGGERLEAKVLPPDALAAIAFTSGSTGEPKGVVVEARSLADELADNPINTDLGFTDRVGLVNPLSFFLGFYNLFENLLRGCPTYLFDLRRNGVEAMIDWLIDNRITVLDATPHAVRSVAASAAERNRRFEDLRRVVIGGEPPQWRDVELLRGCTRPDCELVNLSGSSEAWGLTWFPVKVGSPLGEGPLPAGSPFPGKELLLLDEDGEPVPAGTPGELVTIGRRCSRGYWRNPEGTAARFTTRADGTRVYRSGDLARIRTEDGLVEYVGRKDHMVKIRGYLVEPAEVEQHLTAEDEVAECVVVGAPSRVPGVNQLIAYVVPNPRRWVSGAALRRRLSTEIPSYMVPQVIVEMSALPRNPNGKINRLELPTPTRPAMDTDHDQWSPLEGFIATICERVLGLEDIGRNEDLMLLGADSLAIEELVTALDTDANRTITSADFLQNPTVAALAALPRHAPNGLRNGVMLALVPGGDQTPLFVIAGASGLGIQFREVAGLVGTNRPVYALQARGLEWGMLPDLSIAQMSKRYITAMRSVQPQGPYLIAGFSLGGIIAYDVVRRLRRGGQSVALLALLDVVDAAAPSEASEEQRIMPSVALASSASRRRSLYEALRKLTVERWPYLGPGFWRAWRHDRFIAYWRLGRVLGARYRYRPLVLDDTRVVSIGAAEVISPRIDWSQHISPPPAETIVAGDHLTILRAPFVTELGRVLSAEIDAL